MDDVGISFSSKGLLKDEIDNVDRKLARLKMRLSNVEPKGEALHEVLSELYSLHKDTEFDMSTYIYFLTRKASTTQRANIFGQYYNATIKELQNDKEALLDILETMEGIESEHE